mmetsp:Transcript_7461/g.14594  ORF Transcript_7461/g.14594 Transcript_7461/m.14594 type:complete len:865 (-) Transcript_7461:79-2673(-)|eukprot:scaffold34585_cov221-Amphora_coffeaeformis.AAC.1
MSASGENCLVVCVDISGSPESAGEMLYDIFQMVVTVFRFDGVWYLERKFEVDDVDTSANLLDYRDQPGALSLDGNVLAFGSSMGGVPCVQVFAWNGVRWTNRGSKLTQDGTTFGWSVDISRDGSVIAVGSKDHDEILRYTVFSWDGTEYKQRSNQIPGGVTSSVSLSSNARHIAIGSPLSQEWPGGITLTFSYIPNCREDEIKLRLSLMTDDSPEETSWTLAYSNETIISSTGPFTGSKFSTSTAEFCIRETECLYFEFTDTKNNGIAQPGGYSIFIDDKLYASGAEFLASNRVSIGPCSSMCGNDEVESRIEIISQSSVDFGWLSWSLDVFGETIQYYEGCINTEAQSTYFCSPPTTKNCLSGGILGSDMWPQELTFGRTVSMEYRIYLGDENVLQGSFSNNMPHYFSHGDCEYPASSCDDGYHAVQIDSMVMVPESDGFNVVIIDSIPLSLGSVRSSYNRFRDAAFDPSPQRFGLPPYRAFRLADCGHSTPPIAESRREMRLTDFTRSFTDFVCVPTEVSCLFLETEFPDDATFGITLPDQATVTYSRDDFQFSDVALGGYTEVDTTGFSSFTGVPVYRIPLGECLCEHFSSPPELKLSLSVTNTLSISRLSCPPDQDVLRVESQFFYSPGTDSAKRASWRVAECSDPLVTLFEHLESYDVVSHDICVPTNSCIFIASSESMHTGDVHAVFTLKRPGRSINYIFRDGFSTNAYHLDDEIGQNVFGDDLALEFRATEDNCICPLDPNSSVPPVATEAPVFSATQIPNETEYPIPPLDSTDPPTFVEEAPPVFEFTEPPSFVEAPPVFEGPPPFSATQLPNETKYPVPPLDATASPTLEEFPPVFEEPPWEAIEPPVFVVPPDG